MVLTHTRGVDWMRKHIYTGSNPGSISTIANSAIPFPKALYLTGLDSGHAMVYGRSYNGDVFKVANFFLEQLDKPEASMKKEKPVRLPPTSCLPV